MIIMAVDVANKCPRVIGTGALRTFCLSTRYAVYTQAAGSHILVLSAVVKAAIERKAGWLVRSSCSVLTVLMSKRPKSVPES